VSGKAGNTGDMYNADSGLATSGKLRDYLGATPTSAHIGYNAYPFNGMTVDAATSAGDVALGITLRETLAYDENGEKLLYYKQKLDEAQAVLPGQTVPVLTRGLVLLKKTAFTTSEEPSVGEALYVGANGQLSKLISRFVCWYLYSRRQRCNKVSLQNQLLRKELKKMKITLERTPEQVELIKAMASKKQRSCLRSSNCIG
jgi:hypothetical protein